MLQIARAEKRIVIDDISLQTDDSLSHFALRLAMCSTLEGEYVVNSMKILKVNLEGGIISINDE